MLRQLFEQYLKVEKNYSEHTQAAYLNDLDAFHNYLVHEFSLQLYSTKKVKQISHRMLRAWIGSLLENGISKRSTARKLSSVKTFFSFLRRSEYMDSNPALRVKMPKFEKKLPVFLKEAETQFMFENGIFEENFDGIRDKCIMEILYGCGLRRSELSALDYEDVDLYEQTLRVMGKGGKERILPFGSHVTNSIKQYIESAERDKVNCKDAFFVNKDGKRLSPGSIYYKVKKYIKLSSSVSQQSPHVMRHTFATHLLDNGADLNAIKELLGHKSLASTQVYTHNTISKLKAIHKQAHPKGE